MSAILSKRGRNQLKKPQRMMKKEATKMKRMARKEK